MIEIQAKMTQRCLELLNLPSGTPSFILDIGCGSGLSGEQLTEEGHVWLGIDISRDMLGEIVLLFHFCFPVFLMQRRVPFLPFPGIALEREVDGDLMHHDIGHGLPFKPGMFDGVISVSVLQWLCCSFKRWHDPRKRLRRFFTTLYSCMVGKQF